MLVGWMAACSGGPDPAETDPDVDPVDIAGDDDDDDDDDDDQNGDDDDDVVDTRTGDTGAPPSTGDTGAPSTCPVPWVAPVVDHADCVATWNMDSGDDGSVDSSYTDRYDAVGDLSVTQYSSGARIVYSYDAVSGALTGYTYDFDGNGTDDMVATYTYDAGGALVEVLVTGLVASRTTYVPGPCGPSHYEVDQDGNGSVERVADLVYTPTSSTSSVDEGVNGTIDTVTVTRYDGVLGRIDASETEDDAGHAGPEYVSSYSYGANGLSATLSFDAWVAGYTSSSLTSWTYDGDDRTTQMLTDSNGYLTRSTASWSCPP